MPSYPRESPERICWNCEEDADGLTTVTLETLSGGTTTLPLCRPCHASHYVPLAADLQRSGLLVTHGNRRR